jgi:hypothetical protein
LPFPKGTPFFVLCACCFVPTAALFFVPAALSQRLLCSLCLLRTAALFQAEAGVGTTPYYPPTVVVGTRVVLFIVLVLVLLDNMLPVRSKVSMSCSPAFVVGTNPMLCIGQAAVLLAWNKAKALACCWMEQLNKAQPAILLFFYGKINQNQNQKKALACCRGYRGNA